MRSWRWWISMTAVAFLVTGLGAAGAATPGEPGGGGGKTGPGEGTGVVEAVQTKVTVTLYVALDTSVAMSTTDSAVANTPYPNDVGVGCNWADGPVFDSWVCAAPGIYFELPSDLFGGTVVTAKLRLYPSVYAADLNTTYSAYVMKNVWSEATTWNTNGFDWYSSPSDSVTPPVTAAVPTEWNVTTHVQQWADQVRPNYGFVLWDNSTTFPNYTAYRMTYFESQEVYTALNRRPQLYLEYWPGPQWTCNGEPATYEGTNGDDTIVLGAGRDVIVALGGDDVIDAGGGDDLICAGPGNDVIVGGPGNDVIFGEDGRDYVDYRTAPSGVVVDLVKGTATGGHGSDTLQGIKNILGSNHKDTLKGNGAKNLIKGYSGNDTLQGRRADDTLKGGDGIDTASYATAPSGVSVNLTAGTAGGGDGDDLIFEIEYLVGSKHADDLFGSADANKISGGAGNDLLKGLGGNDRLFGEAGANDKAVGGAGNKDVCDAEVELTCEL